MQSPRFLGLICLWLTSCASNGQSDVAGSGGSSAAATLTNSITGEAAMTASASTNGAVTSGGSGGAQAQASTGNITGASGSGINGVASGGSGGLIGSSTQSSSTQGGGPDSVSAGGANTIGGATTATGGQTSTDGGGGGTDGGSKFLVFLLIGQSNMEGSPQPAPQDREQDERIRVLAYDNCPSLGRTYNEWYTASPPLHSCTAGVGPGDYFAKTLIDGLPEGYTIGLVPLGVNGAPIDVFRKDVPRPGWYLPPDDHWETGFEWIVSRARKAQELGDIRGILFHQGESDAGQPEWVGKVSGLVSDLRTDLGLGNAPFLAGEVYRDGMAANHNTLINELPGAIDNGHVISSEGLTGTDVYHFDLVSQRELGRRYAEKMLELLGPTLAR